MAVNGKIIIAPASIFDHSGMIMWALKEGITNGHPYGTALRAWVRDAGHSILDNDGVPINNPESESYHEYLKLTKEANDD